MIECPACSAKNEEHYKFCLGCGAELGGGRGKIVDRPSSPSVQPASPRARLPDLKERLQALRKGRPVATESVDASVSDLSGNLPGWTAPPAGLSPIAGGDSVSVTTV